MDIDEVVLVPTIPLVTSPLDSPKAASDGVVLGGDCSFLGFPYGGSWLANYGGQSTRMPFTKRCGVSGMQPEPKVWILDGLNNVGFSGGPVIFGSGLDQRVFAVISGYRTEPSEVISAGAHHCPPPGHAADKSKVSTADEAPTKPKQSVNLNSGFIFAYDISYAIDAIHSRPVGPLRETK